MNSRQIFTTICIACCYQAAIGIPEQPRNVAPSNTDMSLNIDPDNIRKSLNVAPNNTGVSPNVAPSDTSDVDTLWFLLDTVLSSFMASEKNNQGTGTLTAFGFCQAGSELKTIDGRGICVPSTTSDDDYD